MQFNACCASKMAVADCAGVVGEAPDGHVRLNGILYKMPEGFPPEVAKEIVMTRVSLKDIPCVCVPQFRLEKALQMKPRFYCRYYDYLFRAGESNGVVAEMQFHKFSCEDSKATLTVNTNDVVHHGFAKLSLFPKPAAAVVRSGSVVSEAKAKAELLFTRRRIVGKKRKRCCGVLACD